MTSRLMTGNGAAAWGARLANVDYVPAFPITPQTEIIETISGWVDSEELRARMVTMESEHSMVTAAGAAATTSGSPRGRATAKASTANSISTAATVPTAPDPVVSTRLRHARHGRYRG